MTNSSYSTSPLVKTSTGRKAIIIDDSHWESEYKDVRILIEKKGQYYFAWSVNKDGSVFGPMVEADSLDWVIPAAEDGIDWVLGERSVLFEYLDIPTKKLDDGTYESHVVGLTGYDFPSATAETVKLSKVLAATKYKMLGFPNAPSIM